LKEYIETITPERLLSQAYYEHYCLTGRRYLADQTCDGRNNSIIFGTGLGPILVKEEEEKIFVSVIN
jgi:hypothetical protein